MSERVTLRIRDTYDLKVTRDVLMELPESVLLCLFPNGLVLNQANVGPDGEMEGEDLYYVDFDGPCLEYVLNFFDRARVEYYGPTGGPPRRPGDDGSGSPTQAGAPAMQNPLFHRQAIIVLREELEYFAIPPKGGPAATDADGAPNVALIELKRTAGEQLLKRRQIFTALQRNVARENNVAEQHLIDMLCMSGFNREDEWGYRSVEPNRCCITSIALVLLKTGIGHAPPGHQPALVQNGAPATNGDGTKPGVTVNAAQLATAQKLLLFWRKPARKCWWDALELPLNGHDVKIWSRRVWTLELSIV